MSTIKTATTVPAGQNQFIGALEGNGGAPIELPVKPLLPELVVGLRRGLTDRLDVGAQADDAAARPPRHHGRPGRAGEGAAAARAGEPVKLALGPAAGFRWISSSGAAMQVSYLTLPFMTGIDVGRHQIVVAPEVGVQLWTSAGANEVWAPMPACRSASSGASASVSRWSPRSPPTARTVAIDYSEGSQMFHLGIGFLY